MIPAVKNVFNFAAALMVLLNLAGCASSGVVKDASPISTGRPVSLDFVLVETSSSLTNLESEKITLNDAIISCLQQRQVFGVVTADPVATGAGSGLKVRVEIREIHKVSEDARLWIGALAGRAQILVQVSVTDLKSGAQIETFEVEGKSGKSATAGTTNEAIERAAEQVAAEMVKISMKTAND